MTPSLGRLVLYTKKVPEMVAFYRDHFGYAEYTREGDRITELAPPGPGGVALLLHPAAKSQRVGQAQVKLVFDVPDVRAFAHAAEKSGLIFGPIHDGGGYDFANSKDPSGNSVQISSRAFVGKGTA